jgi:hypothetical protein
MTTDGHGGVKYDHHNDSKGKNGNVEVVQDGETITWDCSDPPYAFTISFPESPCKTLTGDGSVVCTVDASTPGGRPCNHDGVQATCFKYSVALNDEAGPGSGDPDVIIDNTTKGRGKAISAKASAKSASHSKQRPKKRK